MKIKLFSFFELQFIMLDVYVCILFWVVCVHTKYVQWFCKHFKCLVGHLVILFPDWIKTKTSGFLFDFIFIEIKICFNWTFFIFLHRRIVSLHQIISIGSTNITDTWEPLEEGCFHKRSLMFVLRENGAQYWTTSSNGRPGESLDEGGPWSHHGSAQAQKAVSTSVPGQCKHN